MNCWLFKATPKKLGLTETRRLAVEDGLLCRAAYEAGGDRADHTAGVRFGDLIHVYFKGRGQVATIGSFEVVEPQRHPNGGVFGDPVTGTALFQIVDGPFARLLGSLRSGGEGYEPDPVLKQFTAWPVVSRFDVPTPPFDDALFPVRRALVPAPPPVESQVRSARQFVAYHSAAIMRRPFQVEAGEPFVFLSSKAETFLRTMLGRPTWVIASEMIGGATRYSLAGLFTPLALTRSGALWEVSGPGAQPKSIPDITDRPWMAPLLREQANFSLGINTITSVDALAGLEASWADNERPGYADEGESQEGHVEGNITQVLVNRYERDGRARNACLKAHGRICVVCKTDLQTVYGPIAARVIHVHHRRPISSIGAQYVVDPVKDLVPVCPNCHAVIHANGLISPEDLASVVAHLRQAGAMRRLTV